MHKVTIISLIYRSPEYARFFYKSLKRYTPELENGQAEFLFVANGANPKTLKTLRLEGIPHFEFNPKVLSNDEHLAGGFASPEYLGRVYQAYNFGVSLASNEIVVLLNSDMVLCPGWLPKMLGKWDGSSILATNLVERAHPKYGVFPHAIERNFGSSPSRFSFEKWERFCSAGEFDNGSTQNCMPYMPAMFSKKWFQAYGGYPAGNLGDGENYEIVTEYGDEAFFRVLAEQGIRHKPVQEVVCYHFKEGEKASHFLTWLLDICLPFIARASGLVTILRWAKARYAQSP